MKLYTTSDLVSNPPKNSDCDALKAQLMVAFSNSKDMQFCKLLTVDLHRSQLLYRMKTLIAEKASEAL